VAEVRTDKRREPDWNRAKERNVRFGNREVGDDEKQNGLK